MRRVPFSVHPWQSWPTPSSRSLLVRAIAATFVGRRVSNAVIQGRCLEPISKLPEEDNEAGELNEAKEVLWMIFPAHEDPALPLDLGKEAFDHPAPQEAAQAAPVLRRRFRSVRAVRRDHLDAILA